MDQLEIKDKHLWSKLDHLRKAGTGKLSIVHWRHLSRHVKLSRQLIPLNYLLRLTRLKTLIKMMTCDMGKGILIFCDKMLALLNLSVADKACSGLEILWMLLKSLTIIFFFYLSLWYLFC